MGRVTRVGVPEVLNNKPRTDMWAPALREFIPEKSMKSISERVRTLMVLIGGVAPVNRGDRPVSVNVTVGMFSMAPTCPLICEGHKRTRFVAMVVTPPLLVTAPGRI